MDNFNMTSELLAIIQKQENRMEQVDAELITIKTALNICERDRINLTGQVTGLTKKFISLNRKVQTLQKRTIK